MAHVLLDDYNCDLNFNIRADGLAGNLFLCLVSVHCTAHIVTLKFALYSGLTSII